MFQEQKNKAMQWRPTATMESLKIRADILAKIRHFFALRKVMEVETPLLCSTSVTDPFIESIPVLSPLSGESHYYLQTSPEYAMKRLLAAGSGAIFQITKAFRKGEIGRHHNPEFTMLEWYRPHYNHHDLMNEVDELLQLILLTPPSDKKSYASLFETFLELNPHQASVTQLENCALLNDVKIEGKIEGRDTWLQILMSHLIEPQLGKEAPCFVFDFPASQAALARIIDDRAARFEVYFQGMELANGFYELGDAHEQRQRFEANLSERKKHHLALLPIDEYLLQALKQGLPDCAGVALGIDRLIMLALKHEHIAEVLSFNFERV